MWPRSRREQPVWIALVSVLALAAMIGPVLRSPPQDSFPLSTYPMFSMLIEPVTAVQLAVGLDSDRNDITLSPELIAGTDEVIVAGSTLRQSVLNGSVGVLCDEIGNRIAARDDLSAITSVEIRSDSLDAVAWYQGQKEPISRTVHASCDIDRAQ